MTDLLPCPLCGGDELSHGYVAGGGVEWGTAGCEACDLQVTKATEVQAIAAWNTRALASHIPAGSVDRALILAVEDFINEPRPYPSPEPMEVRDYRHSLYRVWSPLATALTAKPGDGEGLAVPATVVTGPKTVSFVGSPPEGVLTPTQPIRTAEEALEAAAQAVADLNDEETRTGISADAFHRAGLAIRALASRIPAGVEGVEEEAFARMVDACDNPPPPSDELRAFVAKGRTTPTPAPDREAIAITDEDRTLFRELERFVFQGHSGPGLDGEAIEVIAKHRLALLSPAAERPDALAKAVEALDWYGEQARLARLIHSEGDAGRHALAEDGGKRARSVLAAIRGGEAASAGEGK